MPQVNLPVAEFHNSLAVLAEVQSLVGKPKPKYAEAETILAEIVPTVYRSPAIRTSLLAEM